MIKFYVEVTIKETGEIDCYYNIAAVESYTDYIYLYEAGKHITEYIAIDTSKMSYIFIEVRKDYENEIK